MDPFRRLLAAILTLGILSALVGGVLAIGGGSQGVNSTQFVLLGEALIALGAVWVVILVVVGELGRRETPPAAVPSAPKPVPARPEVSLPANLQAPPPGHTWVVTVHEPGKKQR